VFEVAFDIVVELDATLVVVDVCCGMEVDIVCSVDSRGVVGCDGRSVDRLRWRL
jgi:hypothetical protein